MCLEADRSKSIWITEETNMVAVENTLLENFDGKFQCMIFFFVG